MHSILNLIIGAIVVVVIKEIFVKYMNKKTKSLTNQSITDDSLKTLSNNFVWKMVLKVSWYHVAFVIASVIGGAMSETKNIALLCVYILLIVFIIIFSERQKRKHYKALGNVEKILSLSSNAHLQRLVNTDKAILSKEDKKFVEDYELSGKRFGMPITIATFVQIVCSIVMWISTF